MGILDLLPQSSESQAGHVEPQSVHPCATERLCVWSNGGYLLLCLWVLNFVVENKKVKGMDETHKTY